MKFDKSLKFLKKINQHYNNDVGIFLGYTKEATTVTICVGEDSDYEFNDGSAEKTCRLNAEMNDVEDVDVANSVVMMFDSILRKKAASL